MVCIEAPDQASDPKSSPGLLVKQKPGELHGDTSLNTKGCKQAFLREKRLASIVATKVEVSAAGHPFQED